MITYDNGGTMMGEFRKEPIPNFDVLIKDLSYNTQFFTQRAHYVNVLSKVMSSTVLLSDDIEQTFADVLEPLDIVSVEVFEIKEDYIEHDGSEDAIEDQEDEDNGNDFHENVDDIIYTVYPMSELIV